MLRVGLGLGSLDSDFDQSWKEVMKMSSWKQQNMPSSPRMEGFDAYIYLVDKRPLNFIQPPSFLKYIQNRSYDDKASLTVQHDTHMKVKLQ